MSLSLEERLQRNIADNKRILAELGLLKPNFISSTQPARVKQEKRKRDDDSEKPKAKRRKYVMNVDGLMLSEEKDDLVDYENNRIYRRRSRRLQGQEVGKETEKENFDEQLEDSDEENNSERRRSLLNRPMVYGSIPGVKVGTMWETRMEANHAGVHRPTVAGIHGGPEGTYSIVLSGGYEDDIDLGECFTYTGEGGRDLKGTKANPKNLRTAAQSKDQSLSKGNQSLVKSVETGLPVRVVRGYKLRSVYAPEEGYRYDGLYKVEKWWYTTGLAGYGVYKFAMKRLPNQDPPPWTQTPEENFDGSGDENRNKLSKENLEKPSSNNQSAPEPVELINSEMLKKDSLAPCLEPHSLNLPLSSSSCEQSSSGDEQSSSDCEQNSAGVEQISSCVEEGSSVVEQSSSGVEEGSSGSEQCSSGVEEGSSGVEEGSSGVEKCSSGVEEGSFIVEQSSCSVESSSSAEHVSSIVEEGSSGVEQSSSGVEQSSSSTRA